MSEVGRDLWSHSVQLLCCSRAAESWLLRNVSPWLLNTSAGHCSLSGYSVAVLGHPHTEKVFSDVQVKPPVFQFMPIASRHWAPRERAWLHLLYSPFRCFCTWVRPEPLGWAVLAPSVFTHTEMLQSLYHLCGPFLATLQELSLVLRSPELLPASAGLESRKRPPCCSTQCPLLALLYWHITGSCSKQ